MDAGMLSLLGILLALVILVIGSMRGYPIMIIGPVCAAIVFLFSGQPVIENMKGPYAADFGGFATSNFLLFLPACILGSMLGDCGAAQDIAVKVGNASQKIGGKKCQVLGAYGTFPDHRDSFLWRCQRLRGNLYHCSYLPFYF